MCFILDKYSHQMHEKRTIINTTFTHYHREREREIFFYKIKYDQKGYERSQKDIIMFQNPLMALLFLKIPFFLNIYFCLNFIPIKNIYEY